jgi:DNA-binding CsgD family transcriptional regulator
MNFAFPKGFQFSAILNLRERLRTFPRPGSDFLNEAVNGLFAPRPYVMYPYTGYAMSFQSLQYIYIGENIESLTGYTTQEILSDGVALSYHRMHPDDQEPWEKSFAFLLQVLQEAEKEKIPEMQFSLNWRFRKKDGTYITLLQQFVIPEVDEEHNPVLEYGIMSDITPYHKSKAITLTIVRPHPNVSELLYESVSFGDNKQTGLSRREKDILKLVCQGLSSKQIADKLFISENTVRNHRAHIMDKTGSKNAAGLASYAMRHGIV